MQPAYYEDFSEIKKKISEWSGLKNLDLAKEVSTKKSYSFSESNWKTCAGLGWLGISLSEESGGFGGTALETMIIMEEFGKGLVLEPFLETVVLSAGLIDSCGNAEQKKEIIPKNNVSELLKKFKL